MSEKHLTVLGVLVIVALLGGCSAEPLPDPNYLAAEAMIETYEQGKTGVQRNYGDPTYQEALELLGRVDPDSISAPAARELARSIEGEILAFRQREDARLAALAKAERTRKRRAHAMRESRRRVLAHPVTSYPECEDENH